MFNNYSNQNAFNTLQQYQLQQQSQSEYIIQQSFNNLTSSLQKVNYLQGDVCLQNLIIILRCLQTESTESMTRISSPSSSTGQKQSPLNFSLAGKFKAIKQRNHELLIRLLNLRQKLIHSTYMYKIRSQQTQGELDKLSEKIRHLKLIVNNKYSQLKFMRMSKDSMAYKKQSYNYSPLTVPLKDLQKGAEVVEKQSIRMRQELSLLIKYMHGEQV